MSKEGRPTASPSCRFDEGAQRGSDIGTDEGMEAVKPYCISISLNLVHSSLQQPHRSSGLPTMANPMDLVAFLHESLGDVGVLEHCGSVARVPHRPLVMLKW
ncbi:hypothetical protein HAX54_007646 [Datura stramonium]|uniref:Uncharacterized protein n=1 Tax=Datura stramonium TaxID=4076 RepID=A0ABS8TCY5_DATST|nr:hypothetical protein [Datura stramonium]